MFAWETVAPLVVQHSGKVLNLIGNFYHVLEDIVAETATTSTADAMLDAANMQLNKTRGESFITDIADIASISRGMMKQLAKGDRLERKVIYTALIEIIQKFAGSQASKMGDEEVEDYIFLAGQTSESDDFTLIGEDGSCDDENDEESGDDADTDDDKWSMVSSS